MADNLRQRRRKELKFLVVVVVVVVLTWVPSLTQIYHW